ncbi:MAG: acyl-CoA dehydrogenase family protein [Proteobacteria bacterium]|nr:acyl-CoA dehydrogenase family protein [Pseudomonadota bacterium]
MSVAAADMPAAALAMADELRKRADEIEKTRRLPADLSQRFAEAGFYRMCVPEVYGGLELPPGESMRTIEALAQADGSSAWVVFIGATSGTVLALLPPDSAREIFHRPEVLLAGVFAPMGVAVAGDGGFQVNGRWQWGSGTENADWVMGGCRVIRDGETELLRSGVPRSRMMIAPASEVEFLDTWHVSGLCGTGSTDFAMNDLFVPEERAVGLGVDGPLERPLYAFPQFGLLAMGIAAVAMGLARAAIDELVSFAGGKTPQGSSRSLARRSGAQSDVARAEALLRSSRAFYYEAIEAAWESACTKGEIGVEHRRDVRLATTSTTRACAQAVDLMYELGGGTSVYRRSPLQRIFRDIHVATQHMMVGPGTLELTGRLFLGLDTDTAML